MKKIIFAASDIHGHATEFKSALKEAGFERDNPQHLLVLCGDYFDRGTENRAVYTYLDSLKNKLLIRGNHDDSLETVILNGKLSFNDHMNGMERTVREFFRGDYIPEFNFIYTDETTDGYRDLYGFLGEMRDYFETESYVFTHGWLPLSIDTDTQKPYIRPDWRYETPLAWHDARWTEWQKVYRHRPLLDGKTLVVGHRSAEYGSMFDMDRRGNDCTPFYGEGVIAIDALTVKSKRVNILVVEDEFPDPITHEMKLLDHPFNEIKAGRKKVEMRLFDEKRQKVRVGDRIHFTNEKTGESLTVTVVGLHRFGSFLSLANAFTPKELGFKEESSYKIAEIMTEIYTEEAIAKNGTLAIRISLNAYTP